MMRIGVWAVVLGAMLAANANGQEAVGRIADTTADGYRGIWYMNQPQKDQYRYKYSGGFATYPQQHVPMAVYCAAVHKTFFCFGGKTGEENRISNMVSYYDHATGQVPRPVVVVSRATNDTHYNPTLGVDPKGHIYIFCNSHGTGYELDKNDPTHGRSFIYRSRKPYSIESFECVRDDNFSYSQAWPVEGRGLLWPHTRYEKGRRRIFWSTTEDGVTWAEPRQMGDMGQGSYAVGWASGGRVALAMDYHPKVGGLNSRTNIYYVETRDFGKTWTTITGQVVPMPMADPVNPALLRDFEKEKLVVYLKDLAFDAAGHPVILFLTSQGFKSGPESGPRAWHTARWTGKEWTWLKAFESDHNYDHGSLYIETDGTWRVIAPTDAGPQAWGTGGAVAVHLSRDQGQTWQKTAQWPALNGRNQTYVRRPLNAHDDFYGYWADGNAFEPSESDLYFCNKAGRIFRLPRAMPGAMQRVEAVEK